MHQGKTLHHISSSTQPGKGALLSGSHVTIEALFIIQLRGKILRGLSEPGSTSPQQSDRGTIEERPTRLSMRCNEDQELVNVR